MEGAREAERGSPTHGGVPPPKKKVRCDFPTETPATQGAPPPKPLCTPHPALRIPVVGPQEVLRWPSGKGGPVAWRFPWAPSSPSSPPTVGLHAVLASWCPKQMATTPSGTLAALARAKARGGVTSTGSKAAGAALHAAALAPFVGGHMSSTRPSAVDAVRGVLEAHGLHLLHVEVLVVSPATDVATFVDAVAQTEAQRGSNRVTLVELKTGGAAGVWTTKSRMAPPLHALPDKGIAVAHAQLAATAWMFNQCHPGDMVADAAVVVSACGRTVSLKPCLTPFLASGVGDTWCHLQTVGQCIVEARPGASQDTATARRLRVDTMTLPWKQ